VRAYKFLDAHGNGPFTGFAWAPGQWVEAGGAAPCDDGVHGCTVDDLSHWLSASLWEIELDGEIVSARHKVVGSRGRLVRRIDAYDDAVRELAVVGAWRCRDRAVGVLTGELRGRFAASSTLEDLLALGGDVDDTTYERTAGALAVDAAHFALHGNPAQSPFVAACSAGHISAGLEGDRARYDEGYAAERAFQSAWLAERLSLTN
jgi:hypothetical protein